MPSVSIPMISLIAMIFSVTSVVVGLAMLFLVMWQAGKRRDNQLMALYMVTVVFWGVTAFMTHLMGTLGSDPTLFAYGTSLSITFNSFSLYALVTHYAKLWQRRWTRISLAAGGLFCLVVIFLAFGGQLYQSVHITPDGLFNYQPEPIGIVVFFIVCTFYGGALWVLWIHHREREGKLLRGSVVVFLGILSTSIPALHQYSLDTIAIAISSILFTSVILRESLFNPLIEVNRQLAEKEKRLHTIIANAPLILWATNLDGKITLLEGKGLDTAGLNPDDLIGQSVFELYPQAVELEENARKAMGGEEFTYIVNAPHLTFETRYNPLRDAADNVQGVIGVSLDVTERHQAQEALRRTEEKYHAVLENIEDGYYEVDLNGTVTACNDALCRMLGYPRAKIIGTSFRSWTDWSRVQSEVEVFQRALQTGEALKDLESEIIRSDGQHIAIIFSVSLIRDDKNHPIGFRGIINDITERKRGETELSIRMNQLALLRQVETELNEQLDINHVMTIALDAFMRFSHADAGFIGLVEDNLIRIVKVYGNYRSDYSMVYIPLDQAIIGRVVRNQRAELVMDVQLDPDYVADLSETKAQMSFPLSAKDRALGIVNLETVNPENFSADIFEFLKLLTVHVGLAIDNAQLYQQTEAQVDEMRELYDEVRQLEAMKTEMIRIASHDLRNPLSTIIGYMSLVHYDIYPTLGDQQKQFIDAIAHNVERMHNIVDDILSLERIEQAAKGKSAIMVNLKELVESAYAELQEQASAKSQSFEYSAPENPVLVRVDPAQIKEAIVNLVGNAIKYTPENGRVQVRLKSNGERAILEIEDNGFGIPQNQQHQLFQPFFRAKSAETEAIDGTGLGLHLVKNIVERHQGKIVFSSVYSQGSTFGFELPILKE